MRAGALLCALQVDLPLDSPAAMLVFFTNNPDADAFPLAGENMQQGRGYDFDPEAGKVAY
ncbi:hypothetical protein [Rufibacter latericius]|uniref:hypothetical protein n=1 Tax=Rufibacter latericius TaxID=2487040 RepID=UPI000F62C082|nr:hypothetical protein [Rufibacter latericius]